VENPCFVAISRDQAVHFEGIHSREAKVCYNGIDLSFYKPLDIPRTDRFLFLARFSTIKGPDLAIEACKKAGVGLDLVGDFSITNEPDLLERCKRECDGKQIRLIGPATRGECVWWYSQAFAMLHPNQRFREPLGLAPLEAQACGCPVIAWKYGAMKETISHSLLVSSVEDMVKAMRGLVSLNRTRGDLSICRQSVRINSAKFSIARMVDRYAQLCEEAVKTGGW
jgi:glycosyltransferase involved in cell wall biosynthesis